MFRRRVKRTILQNVWAWIWPQGGWGRASRYIGHRIARIPDTPHRIAAGFACGAAVSFTPIVGLHILVAILIAVAVRGNFLAAAIGTAVGNPWTFPFMWASSFEIGNWLLGSTDDVPLSEVLDMGHLMANPTEAIAPILYPFLLGGLVTGVLAWFGFYYMIRVLVAAYQAQRRIRIGAHKKSKEA